MSHDNPVTLIIAENAVWRDFSLSAKYEAEIQFKKIESTYFGGTKNLESGGIHLGRRSDVLAVIPLAATHDCQLNPLPQEVQKAFNRGADDTVNKASHSPLMAYLFMVCITRRDPQGQALASERWAKAVRQLAAQPIPMAMTAWTELPSRFDVFSLTSQCQNLLREMDNLRELNVLRSRIEDLETQVSQLWTRLK